LGFETARKSDTLENTPLYRLGEFKNCEKRLTMRKFQAGMELVIHNTDSRKLPCSALPISKRIKENHHSGCIKPEAFYSRRAEKPFFTSIY